MKDKIIHDKLDKLQFESSIKDGKFLIVKIKPIGYGGQLSMRILGMKLAYIFDRTVIFDDKENSYLNCYEPTSSISLSEIKSLPIKKLELYEKQEDQVVYLDFDEYWLSFKNRRYFNNWLPQELTAQHKTVEYFQGQLMLRFKLLPEYIEYVEVAKKRINFSNPIIGIHIRRGDKNTESPYVPMRIYRYYLKKTVKETGIKKVFVTSDSENIFSELPQDLGLEYIYDQKEKRYNNDNHQLITDNPDLKKQETLTAIKIIESLSDCDYIIGQINTHFTTLAHNLNLVKKGNKNSICFVNRDYNDTYINNDPNLFLFILDISRKYSHKILVSIVRKIKPVIFTNDKFFSKLKSVYYRREM